MHKYIPLPQAQLSNDFPLMEAIRLRRTKRKWREEALSLQEIANLFWVACGISLPQSKRSKSRRTCPSARNSQCISVFIALADGVYAYDDEKHRMVLVQQNDIRSEIGTQKMMKTAPAGLIYVADFSKLKGYAGNDDQRKWFIAGTECGFISQNVYLYCASSKLSTAILGLVDRQKLQTLLRLADSKKVLYTQVIGKQI